MIPYAEALEKVIGGVRPVGAEQVGLNDALGRVLAEDVVARLTQPPVAVSAMDGYAVRAEDVANVPTTLTCLGESAAGGHFDGSVGAGECVRIFTGAPLPNGADAIVIQEDTDVDGTAVTVNEGAPKNKFVRPAGLDFAAGDVLLRTGTVLNARDLGLAAGMNVPWLKVRRRPRIAILATGNEVVMPGDPKGPDQIISSNTVALTGYVKALGGEPVNLGIASDDEDSLRTLIQGARGCDLLVTTGGAAVGDYDLVRTVLDADGFRLSFHNVAMRPGKPVIFGHIDIDGGTVPVLGMPGNPVSTGVSSVMLMRPAIQAMLGIRDAAPSAQHAVLGCDLGANDKRQDYLRATLERNETGTLVATPFGKQDSAMLARLAQADCLVVRAPFAPSAQAGDVVTIVPLPDGI